MPKLELTHEIECSLDAFWSGFFDPALNAKLFLEGLGFRDYKTVSQKETDDKIVRTTAVEPTLSLPPALSKLLGSSFRYSEEGTFDKATKVWRWKLVPSAMADKIRVEGVLRATELGPEKVRRDIELQIEAKVFMVGGLIEETFQKQLSQGWTKGADIQNQWLRAQRAAT
ncbi:MAG: DUF2505 family protein [Polyangiaceae bacterium]|nr:DUF2505 family protein [Polyangiaceae bacterium]